MRDSLGWEAIEDDGAIIGLFDPQGGGAISLEPGGQFELSGAPLEFRAPDHIQSSRRISTLSRR